MEYNAFTEELCAANIYISYEQSDLYMFVTSVAFLVAITVNAIIL